MQLEEFLESSAARCPEKVALVCAGQRLTYAQLEARANRLAHGLIARGVGRGDRVIVFLENRIEAAISIWAILKAGAVFVMCNPTTKTDKLVYLLNDSRAAALITVAGKLAPLGNCWAQTPHLRLLLVVEGEAPDALHQAPPIAQAFAALEQEFESAVSPPKKLCIDLDLAALVYTSGSTGQPKGVMLTHLNMVSAATSITQYLRNSAQDVILNVLPLSFDYGLYQWLMSVKMGATLVLERSFAFPHEVLSLLRDERVTGFPVVPTMVAILLQMDLTKYDLTALRYLTNTGAALPVEHIRRLRLMLPAVQIFSMYGLTECKRVSYLPPEEIDKRPDSVGRGMPNEEVYLVGDAGERLGPHEVGELVVRGSNVMRGYWHNALETAKKLKPGPLPGEMVLYTGDLFRQDEEGFLYFVGRRDDMIKSRGEKVAPKEVENVLHSHEGVAEAVVVGVPDVIFGQKIKAVVVAKPGAQLSEREILRHCALYLEDFMVPHLVELRSHLPQGVTGKVDKKILATMPEA